jgi:hypothetical protein
VRTAIGIAQRGQALGFDDIAASAMSSAVSIATAWGDSGGDGQATSIPDWLGIASKLELIGADQSAIEKARANMTQAAKDAYDGYNKHACRTTINDITCFLKAAQFLAMTGSEPTSFANDVAYQVTNARNHYKGKDKLCPVEKYLLRITTDSQGGDGQNSRFDTGLLTLTVKDHAITSPDDGPLVLTSGRASCWAQTDTGWVRIGEGTLTGGSFPIKVRGVDDGTTLHVRLTQRAKVSVTVGGDIGCQAMGALGQDFLNTFLRMLSSPGLELPAGQISEELTETTHDVFEPTGETTTTTIHTIFKQIYPKREVPDDPYS